MDTARFDDLVRALAAAASRRGLLAVFAGGVLGLVPLMFDAEAKKKKKKKKKKKRAAPPPPVSPPPPPPVSPPPPSPPPPPPELEFCGIGFKVCANNSHGCCVAGHFCCPEGSGIDGCCGIGDICDATVGCIPA